MVRLVGAARAFEGHVEVTVGEDGVVTPLATGYVTGRMDENGTVRQRGDLRAITVPALRRPATHHVERGNGEPWQACVIVFSFCRPSPPQNGVDREVLGCRR